MINLIQECSGLGWYDNKVQQVLVISPPPLGAEIDPGAAEMFVDGASKIGQMPPIYAGIAQTVGAHFFDAATVVDLQNMGPDGIHLLVAGNQLIGDAVAEKVHVIFDWAPKRSGGLNPTPSPDPPPTSEAKAAE